MKSILIILVTLSLILGAGYFTISEVSGTSDMLMSHCLHIKTGVERDCWEEALLQLKEFNGLWENVKLKWTILINHKEIDTIDMTLARIGEYLKTGEKGLALGEISVLELLIKHIPATEKVTLKNIF